ncbi:hypothetical protein J7K93_04030 [bacterium]|nr:hypothetical protein [bacterium]
MFKKRKFLLIIILFLLFIITGSLPAQTVFDQKKQEYLDTMGEQCRSFHERIWAWLEKMKNGTLDGNTYYVTDIDGVSKPALDIVHNIIISWGSLWTSEGYAPYAHAWHYGEWQSSVMLLWILYDYGDVIYPSDKQFIQNLYDGVYRSNNVAPGAPNSQIADWVARYLYSQYHKNIYINYSTDPPPSQNVIPFMWNGKLYSIGERYNEFELSEAYINYLLDKWVKSGNNEFDSPVYSWCIIHSISALQKFSEDPVMKRKAEIFIDFYLIDSVMDYGGQQWGGELGRSYEEVYRKGWGRFYWDIFWGGPRPSHEPSRSIYFSDYRLPDIIFDIGDLSDEPDNYYHINMEYNRSITRAVNTGKWDYVTKFYSLGGGATSNWQLCIKSDDEPGSYGRPGIPFRLWINTKDVGEDVSHPVYYMNYLTTGEQGFQYKNAMFIKATFFHVALRSNAFDVDQTIGNWRFLKEGRTMVAIRIRTDVNTSALEVAIEGVDYASLDDFEAAIFANADLGTGKYITSKGDWIGYNRLPGTDTFVSIVKKGGIGDFGFVFTFPFKRLEAIDNNGKYLVRWSGDKMIVRKHGKQIEYDFDNWTKTLSNAPADNTPPRIPTGVTANQKQE